MSQDTIYIVGAGAIGKVLAVVLKREGRNVILVRGSVNDGRRLNEKIEVELPDLSIVEAEVETATLSLFTSMDGLILFTNKSFGNDHLAKAVYEKNDHSPIVIMQNGLHVEHPFVKEGFRSIYRCVLFATSHPVSTNQFRFKPVAPSPIGLVKGRAEGLQAVVQTINNRYFPFRDEPNIEPVVWTKTIVNCVFNSVCPLLEIDNGIFHRNEKALLLARRVISECAGVAKAMGILLHEEEVVNTLLHISKLSDGQLISTYQDLQNRRQTEIATLNGAVVDTAKKLALGASVKETGLLGDLILLKSELNR
jgi:2-dehydropantoate 2-reductase